jgi:predicted acetyltransferase
MEARAEAVSVRLAGSSERQLIENLSQFYIYDFSEMEPPGSGEMEFGDQGGYSGLPDLDSYWRVEGFRPLLIRVEEWLVGFALVNTRSHRGGSVEHNMGEFFVARKYRRLGVATEAVGQILMQYPGHWEVAVAERNLAARVFWPRALAAAPNVCQPVLREGDGAHWRGPIWSFRAAPLSLACCRPSGMREPDCLDSPVFEPDEAHATAQVLNAKGTHGPRLVNADRGRGCRKSVRC